MAETILTSPFFMEIVLPFLLVFTLIFAILDKTQVLGEGKRQINAIIAFVIGLILIAFPGPRNLIVNLMPLLVIMAVVMMIFLMLYSFAGGDTGEKWLKITFGVLVGLVLIIALLVFSGVWGHIVNAFKGGYGSSIVTNVVFVVIIVAAIIIVLVSGGKGGGGG